MWNKLNYSACVVSFAEMQIILFVGVIVAVV